MCDPPRLVRSLIVLRTMWVTLSISSEFSEHPARVGDKPVRHKISSHSRFPIPEIFVWSKSAALIVARLFLNTWARSSFDISIASGPSKVSSGFNSTLPKLRGSTTASVPPPSKFMTKRICCCWTSLVVYSNSLIVASPSKMSLPVIPNLSPTTAVPISNSSNFPVRRA